MEKKKTPNMSTLGAMTSVTANANTFSAFLAENITVKIKVLEVKQLFVIIWQQQNIKCGRIISSSEALVAKERLTNFLPKKLSTS